MMATSSAEQYGAEWPVINPSVRVSAGTSNTRAVSTDWSGASSTVSGIADASALGA